MTHKFEHELQGVFSLANQNKYFGGWPVLKDSPLKIVMSFNVEGEMSDYAHVILQQIGSKIHGQVYAEESIAKSAFTQAIENISADIDGEKWSKVTDKVLKEYQEKYLYLRPNLFNSTFESAAGFVIGNRLRISQKQSIVKKMAESFGDTLIINDKPFYAFPSPGTILQMEKPSSINDIKWERLHEVSRAVKRGILKRGYLRSLPTEMALAKLKEIKGIGEFYAQGILFRGAGIVNEITQDDLTPHAIQLAYNLQESPNNDTIERITESWKPYKMWALVLLHIWLRQENKMPKRSFE